MTLRDLTPQMAERLEMPRGTQGVVVMDVEAGEAAEDAGLSRGDVIVSVNGQAVDGVTDFERAIEAARARTAAPACASGAQGNFFVAVVEAEVSGATASGRGEGRTWRRTRRIRTRERTCC